MDKFNQKVNEDLALGGQNSLLSMITKIRSDLDCLEKEISASLTPTEAPPSEPMAPEVNPTPVANSAPVDDQQSGDVAVTPPTMVIDLEQERLRQESIKRQQMLEKLQRAAGTFYLSKKISTLETHPVK